ncbi:obg-like ATPase 1 [[Candida] railenensis]|uniref:Obg-like ATPase homolog n=1 Tax=[Candida] railenensis TaxID=45579 RepID=A0A9P0QK44_9ASCO|nr:obg-like ATPase 1 [[Candida] railenensis]
MRKFVRFFSRSILSLEKKSSKSTPKKVYLGRPSNNLTSGIVGLANVGKSTFFQAITNSTLGNPANYPFATIEPEEARVVVKSAKLDHLANLFQSEKKIPASLSIVDIAGLTRNAARGEGLGNKFLSDIRQVDGIFQVVRGFRDDEIIHIEKNIVDPVRDLEIVSDELMLKDMDFVESAIERTTKSLKKPGIDKVYAQLEISTLGKVLEGLYEGKKVSVGEWNNEEVEILNTHNFLTAKPTVFLLNVNEQDFLAQKNEFKEGVEDWVKKHSPGDEVVLFSGAYEKEIAGTELDSKSALPYITHCMRSVLRLISFFTCGPVEAHQWTIREGSTAPEAAGSIHTDLQKTFISAQIYKYSDLEVESAPLEEARLKSKGRQLRVGKTYLMEDGDVMLVKAAGGKSR